MRKKRIAALAICVVFLAMVFSSLGLIAAHAHHHCTGEDCPVCAAIRSTEALLHSFSILLAVLYAVFLFRAIRSAGYIRCRFHYRRATLVSLKVKLSD